MFGARMRKGDNAACVFGVNDSIDVLYVEMTGFDPGKSAGSV